MIEPPRRIRPDDDVGAFSCGQPVLDRWLQQRAVLAERDRTAVTYVVTDGRVVGYYCLSGHSVVRGSVGGGWFARNAPEAIPAVLLGRLAVDRTVQGRGLGASLLAHAIITAREASELVGLRALVVDPIDDDAVVFYERYGFHRFPSGTKRLFLPLRHG